MDNPGIATDIADADEEADNPGTGIDTKTGSDSKRRQGQQQDQTS